MAVSKKIAGDRRIGIQRHPQLHRAFKVSLSQNKQIYKQIMISSAIKTMVTVLRNLTILRNIKISYSTWKKPAEAVDKNWVFQLKNTEKKKKTKLGDFSWRSSTIKSCILSLPT